MGEPSAASKIAIIRKKMTPLADWTLKNRPHQRHITLYPEDWGVLADPKNTDELRSQVIRCEDGKLVWRNLELRSA